MRTPEKFFEDREGIHPHTATKKFMTITPDWACILLREYALELFKEKEAEISDLLKQRDELLEAVMNKDSFAMENILAAIKSTEG